jgi:hypothetical protein
MKRSVIFSLILFGTIAITCSCEKEDHVRTTRDDIKGNWLFEKKHVDTIYIYQGLIIDTTVIIGNQFFIINNSDTSYIKDLEGNQISANIIYFKPPDSLFYNACPIDFMCITSAIIPYKIVELSKNEMILRTEQEINRGKTIKELHYYQK